MKEYQVMPKVYDKDIDEIVIETGDCTYFTRYAEAVRYAKKISHAPNEGALLDYYEVKRSDYDSAYEYREEIEGWFSEHLMWCENYKDGEQVPVDYRGDIPIWRKDKQSMMLIDLKPRKEKGK